MSDPDPALLLVRKVALTSDHWKQLSDPCYSLLSNPHCEKHIFANVDEPRIGHFFQ